MVKLLRPVWPAVVFSALSPTRLHDIPEPELPGRRWVRVQNKQCGICASDLSLMYVDVDPVIAPAALPTMQRFYLGHEVVGNVTEVGAGVTRLKVGDRVLMDTRFQGSTCLSQEIDPPCTQCAAGNPQRCENTAVDTGGHGVGGGWGDGFTAHETELYRVPDELTDDQAMLIEPMSTGMRAVLSRRPAAGQRALIVGSGMVGLSTLQSLRAVVPECRITVFARHAHQAEIARRLGADEVVRGEDGYQAAARLTGAKLYKEMFGNRMLLGGFDVIYDCVGSARTLHDNLRWARAGGSVVLVGVKLYPFKIDLTPIWFQEVMLTGVFAHGAEPWPGGPRHTYDVVIELLRQGKLTTDGFITHRFALEKWQEAVATARDKRTGSIKVVLQYS